MLIICDYRLPETMRTALATLGHIAWFNSGQVYAAIEGHPDIFMCQIPGMVITAPNMPEAITDIQRQSGVITQAGESNIGDRYPRTARYNAVAAHGYFIHNLNSTDRKLLKMTQHMKQIHVAQGYTRCNLLPLPDGSFITSDKGIQRTLQRNHLDVFWADPSGIVLPGCANGFIGGTAGWCGDQLVFAGNPLRISAGASITHHLTKKGIHWITLADEPLVDVGGLFFLGSPA